MIKALERRYRVICMDRVKDGTEEALVSLSAIAKEFGLGNQMAVMVCKAGWFMASHVVLGM